MTVSTVLVAIGGNIGEVEKNLAEAVDALNRLPRTRVAAVSSLYRTAPVGGPVNEDGTSAQPDFLNGAVKLETGLEPEELMRELLQIERSLGRVREIPDGPRTVDLDVALWGERIVDTPDLKIPHPRMHLRLFVLAPIMEIAPDAIHPVIGRTVAELHAALEEPGSSPPAPIPFHPPEGSR